MYLGALGEGMLDHVSQYQSLLQYHWLLDDAGIKMWACCHVHNLLPGVLTRVVHVLHCEMSWHLNVGMLPFSQLAGWCSCTSLTCS